MTDDLDDAGPAAPTPMNLVSELFRAVPRFVDRTRSQAELVATLAGHLPCFGGTLGNGSAHDAVDRATTLATTGESDTDRVDPEPLRESVPVDVLSVLEAEVDGSEVPTPSSDGAATEVAAPPTEAELPIESYDSLAASQVVPRLAILDEAELLAVRRYESAHRNRQTILNRIAQRLEG